MLEILEGWFVELYTDGMGQIKIDQCCGVFPTKEDAENFADKTGNIFDHVFQSNYVIDKSNMVFLLSIIPIENIIVKPTKNEFIISDKKHIKCFGKNCLTNSTRNYSNNGTIVPICEYHYTKINE